LKLLTGQVNLKPAGQPAPEVDSLPRAVPVENIGEQQFAPENVQDKGGYRALAARWILPRPVQQIYWVA